MDMASKSLEGWIGVVPLECRVKIDAEFPGSRHCSARDDRSSRVGRSIGPVGSHRRQRNIRNTFDFERGSRGEFLSASSCSMTRDGNRRLASGNDTGWSTEGLLPNPFGRGEAGKPMRRIPRFSRHCGWKECGVKPRLGGNTGDRAKHASVVADDLMMNAAESL